MSKDNKYLIEFDPPVVFEDKTYKQLDLSELENLKAEDFYNVNKKFSTEEYISPKPEADPKFCAMMAAHALSLPEEFFNSLSAKNIIKIRNVVVDFFLE